MNPREQLKAINAEIGALKKKERELDRRFRKESRDRMNAIPFEYTYEVVEPSVQDDVDSFRILRTLVNYQVYQDIIKEYGHPTSTGAENNETNLSVSYYRKNGIVSHKGGGWIILDEPFACDDEEWGLLIRRDDDALNRHIK